MQPTEAEYAVRFETWRPVAEAAARRVAPILRRYGWDADDATQTACVKLLAVVRSARFGSLVDDCLRRTIPRIVRKTLLRAAARPRNLIRTVEDQILSAAADRGASSAAEALTNVLADAPTRVREYIEVVISGGTPPEDWRLRRWAARWLEGRLA